MNNLPAIPGYRIVGKLGEGGMSTVYEGIQEKLNRRVAVKILEPSLLRNNVIAARFLIEAETAANLNHSNIISIFDIGHTDQHQYIVQEYLVETLKDFMFGFPQFKLTPKTALEILKPIAEALDYAHSKGIIHRDIKTENIMFREDRTPVLMDFGIARALDSDSHMTRTGISLGTPFYMSPEQCRADVLDGRSDFYSLGVVLHEMLTGNKPYIADNPTAVALKHIQDPLPILPESLARYQVLLDKMLAKNKEDRIANGAQMIQLIQQLEAGAYNDIFSGTSAFPSVTQTMMSSQTQQRTSVGMPAQHPSPTSQTPSVKPGQTAQRQTVNIADIPAPQPLDEDFTEELDDLVDLPLIDTTPARPIKAVRPQQPKSSLKSKVEIAVLGILLIIVFIIFYNLGRKDTPQASAPLPAQVTAAQELPATANGQGLQFKETLAQAQKYLDDGDLDKAKALVDALKVTNDAPELLELDTRLSNESAFSRYAAAAQEYFDKKQYTQARENLTQALALKTTPQLETLSRQLDNIQKHSPAKTGSTGRTQPNTRLSDDAAFTAAKTSNTQAAFRQYMDAYPTGKHFDTAIAQLNRLKEEEQIRSMSANKPTIKSIKLRTFYKTLNYNDAEAMIIKYRFFDNGFNKSGTFKNSFEKRDLEGTSVLLDRVTNLMWNSGSVGKVVSFRKAERWVSSLNRSKYGGYVNWRLPTLAEAASLLKRFQAQDGLYLTPKFEERPQSIWTGDSLRPQTLWVVRFNSGTIFADSDRSKQRVLAVRSAN